MPSPPPAPQPSALPEQPRTAFYSPELPWRPRVSPPSVEDKDACAIYASVRKDATPSREPVTLALTNLQKMLHRAGNVDGEGDGCGVQIDIPREIWSEAIRAGGHASHLALDPCFAVLHAFIARGRGEVPATQERAREIMSRVGLRVLAERENVVDSTALGQAGRARPREPPEDAPPRRQRRR